MAGSLLDRFELRTGDPEFAHEVLRDAYADFSVAMFGSTEDFEFAHVGVSVPGATLARVRYSMGARFDVRTNPDLFLVTTPAGGAVGFDSDGEPLRPGLGHPVLASSGEAGWRATMEDPTIDTVSLDPATIARVAGAEFGTDPRRLRFTSLTPVSSTAARYWNSVVAHVRRDVLDHDDIAAAPLIVAGVTRSLASAALVTFPNTGLRSWDDDPSPGRAEPATVRRAVAYIEEHAAEDIGVDDIAAAARVSVRALQLMFRRYRGVTPREELRQVRLSHAHEDLLAGDPTRGDTVAAIAARWGFANSGRFSGQYREAYGYSPMRTLHS